MEEWMQKCLVFAATYFSGLYLAHLIEQRKPPKPSLSSDLKRYLESDSDPEEIPESIEQALDKAEKFFEEWKPGPTFSRAFVRIVAASDPELRELLDNLFSSRRGSGSGEQENDSK